MAEMWASVWSAVWLVDVMVATMAVEWVASMDSSWVDCECIHVHECE